MTETKRVFLLLVVLATLAFAGSAWAAPTLEFLPSTATFTSGQTVDVVVQATGLGSEIVSAFDLDVAYNSAMLGATGVSFFNYLGDPGFFEALINSDLTTLGTVDFAEISLLSDADLSTLQSPLAGTVKLATLEFLALSDGDISSLAFAFPPGNDVKGWNNQVIIPTPEPGSCMLLSCGLAGLVGIARRNLRRR